jgi:hypothetical protein
MTGDIPEYDYNAILHAVRLCATGRRGAVKLKNVAKLLKIDMDEAICCANVCFNQGLLCANKGCTEVWLSSEGRRYVVMEISVANSIER